MKMLRNDRTKTDSKSPRDETLTVIGPARRLDRRYNR
jgi:hypothetical protein